jgi:hypothetical protein
VTTWFVAEEIVKVKATFFSNVPAAVPMVKLIDAI